MHECKAIEIVTPKKIVLNGLWLGPRRPKRVIIWVHGLGSSMFSKLRLAELLVHKDTAVIVFNNRGHDVVARVSHAKKKGLLGGAAHEVFTDCVDDIQGAVNFARRAGVKNMFLAGHSTGCQKSIYWASKTVGRGVKGIILLAPVSDYAAEVMLNGKQKVERALAIARELVRRGKKHTLLPENAWPATFDAQRFLSLCDPQSSEEIFSYAQPKKNPKILKSVRLPMLILLAEKDEYGDRPASRIAAWFREYVKARDVLFIIPRVSHSFRGAEVQVASLIRRWITSQK